MDERLIKALKMDDLTNALIAAGEELAREHAWSFDGDPGCPPAEDNPFVEVTRKHVAPLVDVEGWRAARVAALKAELALYDDDRMNATATETSVRLEWKGTTEYDEGAAVYTTVYGVHKTWLTTLRRAKQIESILCAVFAEGRRKGHEEMLRKENEAIRVCLR